MPCVEQLTLLDRAVLVWGMDKFWMPEEITIDFRRHIYVIAHRMRTSHGYDLERGRFWLLDQPDVNLTFFGMYIETASCGFDPYRVMLGGVEVGGYTSFVDAFWGLHAIRNMVAIEQRHLSVFGHPCTDACDPLDCDSY